MKDFISGAIMMAYAVAGLFFLRFWKKTRDRLFLIFGFAFLILAANRVPFILIPEEDEARTYLYVVRFLAFLLILAAIVDKNRKSRG